MDTTTSSARETLLREGLEARLPTLTDSRRSRGLRGLTAQAALLD